MALKKTNQRRARDAKSRRGTSFGRQQIAAAHRLLLAMSPTVLDNLVEANKLLPEDRGEIIAVREKFAAMDVSFGDHPLPESVQRQTPPESDPELVGAAKGD